MRSGVAGSGEGRANDCGSYGIRYGDTAACRRGSNYTARDYSSADCYGNLDTDADTDQHARDYSSADCYGNSDTDDDTAPSPTTFVMLPPSRPSWISPLRPPTPTAKIPLQPNRTGGR